MHSPPTQLWTTQFCSLHSESVSPLSQFSDVSNSFGLVTVSWTPAVNVLSVARQEESEGLSGSGHFSHWTQLMKALGPHDAEILSYKEPLVGIDLGYSPYAVSNHRKSTGEMRIHNIHSRS